MAKSNTPVSSFGPEILAVLRAGCETRNTYDLPTPQAAFRFMSRLNSLRAAMKREAHPDSDRVYRAGVKINRDNRCQVIVEPRDSEFRDMLSRAEIRIASPEDPILVPTPRPGTSQDAADSFLSTLTSKKDVDNP